MTDAGHAEIQRMAGGANHHSVEARMFLARRYLDAASARDRALMRSRMIRTLFIESNELLRLTTLLSDTAPDDERLESHALPLPLPPHGPIRWGRLLACMPIAALCMLGLGTLLNWLHAAL